MIDDEFVIEADQPLMRTRPVGLRWAVLAAAGVLLALGAALIMRVLLTRSPAPTHPPVLVQGAAGQKGDGPNAKQVYPDLPLLTISIDTAESAGFGGVILRDADEIGISNPWQPGIVVRELPVYRNLAVADTDYPSIALSESELLALAEQFAARLGEEIDEVQYQYDTIVLKDHREESILSGVRADVSSGEIVVASNGAVNLRFDPPVALPKGLKFSASDESNEQAQAALDYLIEHYAELLQLQQPYTASPVQYIISGQQLRRYIVYEGIGSVADQIAAYSLAPIEFVPDEAGQIYALVFRNLISINELVSMYPLVTPQQAQGELLAGRYVANVPSEFLEGGVIKAEHVAGVELIYRVGSRERYYMPYYRFYVLLPTLQAPSQAEGLQHYGIFDVPAIDACYLETPPLWD